MGEQTLDAIEERDARIAALEKELAEAKAALAELQGHARAIAKAADGHRNHERAQDELLRAANVARTAAESQLAEALAKLQACEVAVWAERRLTKARTVERDAAVGREGAAEAQLAGMIKSRNEILGERNAFQARAEAAEGALVRSDHSLSIALKSGACRACVQDTQGPHGTARHTCDSGARHDENYRNLVSAMSGWQSRAGAAEAALVNLRARFASECVNADRQAKANPGLAGMTWVAVGAAWAMAVRLIDDATREAEQARRT